MGREKRCGGGVMEEMSDRKEIARENVKHIADRKVASPPLITAWRSADDLNP